jgi:hypothetical protein
MFVYGAITIYIYICIYIYIYNAGLECCLILLKIKTSNARDIEKKCSYNLLLIDNYKYSPGNVGSPSVA